MDSLRERERLAVLIARLRALDLTLPLPHERGIHAVARQALADEIHAIGHRLDDGAYWRQSLGSDRRARSA